MSISNILNDLPAELLYIIFSNLDNIDLFELRQCSKLFELISIDISHKRIDKFSLNINIPIERPICLKHLYYSEFDWRMWFQSNVRDINGIKINFIQFGIQPVPGISSQDFLYLYHIHRFTSTLRYSALSYSN
jgi:hypothetical protein